MTKFIFIPFVVIQLITITSIALFYVMSIVTSKNFKKYLTVYFTYMNQKTSHFSG